MNPLVLVVDDEPDVEVLFRQQFRRDLRAGRFTMEFAQSASVALQRIADAADVSLILILSDINMPGMNGLELLPKAKALRPDVPVIMITAYGDADTKRKAFDGGAEALLTKPIDFVALATKLICVSNEPHNRECRETLDPASVFRFDNAHGQDYSRASARPRKIVAAESARNLKFILLKNTERPWGRFLPAGSGLPRGVGLPRAAVRAPVRSTVKRTASERGSGTGIALSVILATTALFASGDPATADRF